MAALTPLSMASCGALVVPEGRRVTSRVGASTRTAARNSHRSPIGLRAQKGSQALESASPVKRRAAWGRRATVRADIPDLPRMLWRPWPAPVGLAVSLGEQRRSSGSERLDCGPIPLASTGGTRPGCARVPGSSRCDVHQTRTDGGPGRRAIVVGDDYGAKSARASARSDGVFGREAGRRSGACAALESARMGIGRGDRCARGIPTRECDRDGARVGSLTDGPSKATVVGVGLGRSEP